MNKLFLIFACVIALNIAPLAAQTVLLGDHSVDGKLCVGVLCDGTEEFDEFSLKIKHANTSNPGIFFEDTHNISGFADRDWAILANEIFEDKFAIRDVEAGYNTITILPDAGANAIFLDSDGEVGFGTSLPQMDLHVVGGDSPALRLEQNTTGGMTAQTWDVGGNETSFFIRDATNSDQLPFRIAPGAQSGSLIIAANSNIGMGTNTPEQKLHIQTNAASTDAFALFDANGAGSDAAFLLRQNGTTPTTWEFRNQQSSGRLNVGVVGGTKPLKIDSLAATNLLRVGLNGEPNVVSVTGELRVNNTALTVPDYVFADDYTLRPLADVRAFIDANSHLPEVPSDSDIKANGLNMTQMQMTHLKKIEELTLYTLNQEDRITDQTAIIAQLMARLAKVEALLTE